jgi:endonuclease/exonuclease/phosphatase family metal-dependent hydrolase
MIVGGDFNCVLNKKDSTGHPNYSRALDAFVHVFELQDVWQEDSTRNGFMHYSPTGARRIDRIYTTRKRGMETVAVAFTDHLAVILRLSIDVPSYDVAEDSGK